MFQLFFIKHLYLLAHNFKNFLFFELAQNPAGAFPGHPCKVGQISPANGQSKFPAKVDFIDQVKKGIGDTCLHIFINHIGEPVRVPVLHMVEMLHQPWDIILTTKNDGFKCL